jgi:hypothetical protein
VIALVLVMRRRRPRAVRPRHLWLGALGRHAGTISVDCAASSMYLPKAILSSEGGMGNQYKVAAPATPTTSSAATSATSTSSTSNSATAQQATPVAAASKTPTLDLAASASSSRGRGGEAPMLTKRERTGHRDTGGSGEAHVRPAAAAEEKRTGVGGVPILGGEYLTKEYHQDRGFRDLADTMRGRRGTGALPAGYAVKGKEEPNHSRHGASEDDDLYITKKPLEEGEEEDEETR